ncbi:unnamed protein product [Hydatigera taeniaeformis]|uniref:DNA primase n=1 Tax=Hydatigena taeniaeformis TaxID=6205 RepID=A0A158RF90_HYDTA|nr:unnamed protein product [Hydatigera taeniaeformis]
MRELLTRNAMLERQVAELRGQIDTRGLTKLKTPRRPLDFTKYVELFFILRFTKRRVALKILYLGWDYCGLARQEITKCTIAEKLIEAFMNCRLIEESSDIRFAVCGRTDKGVSGFSQVVALTLRSNVHDGVGVIAPDDTSKLYPPKPEIDYVLIGNKNLPPDIRILSWSPVPLDFSPRRDCISRSYKYFFPAVDLDIECMRLAASKLIGHHDFRNFCSSQVANGVLNHERTIFKIEIFDSDADKTSLTLCLMCRRCQENRITKWRRVISIIALYNVYTLAEPLLFFEPEFENMNWQSSLDMFPDRRQEHYFAAISREAPSSKEFKRKSILERPTDDALEEKVRKVENRGKLRVARLTGHQVVCCSCVYSTMASAENIDQDIKIFYKKLFPCDLLCKWLSCGSKQPFETLSRREFSFSFAGDVYLRYQSFGDPASFRSELVRTCPNKIDIGAVYSAPPRLQRSLSSTTFVPEWKELVFDIDLTDYDDIRFCCGSANPNAKTAVCHRCWELAKCAVICLERALRCDFGFEHILWVYSGRRGVHCWVCDPVARHLDSAGRSAVAEYLTFVHSSDARKQKLKISSLPEPLLHPSVEAAADTLDSHFVKYCASQNLLNSHFPDRVKLMLQHLPPDLDSQRNVLFDQWANREEDNSDSTVKRWNTLKCFLQSEKRDNVIKDIILNTVYPRLDTNVTNGFGHLLKSPFCVHPKTGFICVPIDSHLIESFDPLTVPRLNELVSQLSQANTHNEVASQHLLAYKHTTLRPYVEFFERFVDRLSASMQLTSKSENDVDTTGIYGGIPSLEVV